MSHGYMKHLLTLYENHWTETPTHTSATSLDVLTCKYVQLHSRKFVQENKTYQQ